MVEEAVSLPNISSARFFLVADTAGNTFSCSFCVYECRGRAELTLHTKCRHPEAIRSGAYPILDNEPSIIGQGYSQLRCGDCGCMFDRECDLIVHSWTHLAAHKTLKDKEQNAIAKEKEAR